MLKYIDMKKFTLNREQVIDLVSVNKYLVNERRVSRCIDGRYQNRPNLPALAFPGADVGLLALVLATADTYGFTVDRKKLLQSVFTVLGGYNHFHFHTDDHGDKEESYLQSVGSNHHYRERGADKNQTREYEKDSLGNALFHDHQCHRNRCR